MGCLDAALKAQLCSPHLLLLQRVVQRGWLQSSYRLLQFTGQGATVGRSQCTGRLQGAHRQVSFSIAFDVMVLAPSWIAPGSLDISLSFREWRRNMGMVCLLPLALVIPLWAVAATLKSRECGRLIQVHPGKKKPDLSVPLLIFIPTFAAAHGCICVIVAEQGRSLFSSLPCLVDCTVLLSLPQVLALSVLESGECFCLA